MKFTKMHGCGNDYVYINCFKEDVEDPAALSIALSDRHFGVGSDGLILICPSDKADVKMAMYNADGSEGKMCGNGIRCLSAYVYERGILKKTELSVETGAGIKQVTLSVKDGKVESVRVNMGSPILKPSRIPALFEGDLAVDVPIDIDGKKMRTTCVSMGNPHAIFFVDDPETFPLETIGPLVENHPAFPDRVNAEFVRVISRDEVSFRVWERGSGETLACGTGACAVAVACVLNKFTDEKLTVHVRGGDLFIEYDRAADAVWMSGPAAFVFDGEI